MEEKEIILEKESSNELEIELEKESFNNINIDLSDYAKKDEIPNKLSQLENDENFISSESDPTVPNHVKSITQEDIKKWNTNTGGGSSNIYSANEEIIGTYFGKPLYRKVATDIVIQKSTVYNETMIATIYNIDKMVRMYGTVDYTNGCHQIGAYANTNFYSLLQYTKQFNTVYFYGANNYIGQKATVIMEYTKTTD